MKYITWRQAVAGFAVLFVAFLGGLRDTQYVSKAADYKQCVGINSNSESIRRVVKTAFQNNSPTPNVAKLNDRQKLLLADIMAIFSIGSTDQSTLKDRVLASVQPDHVCDRPSFLPDLPDLGW